MSRLVDVEPLDCLAWKDGENGTTFDDGVLWVLEKIGELPSVQPQPEIVRCRDCKWKQGSECVRFADVRPFPDDFCSRAERRTE